MAGRVHGADGGALHAEALRVQDGLLARVGSVFVNGVVEVRVAKEEIRNAARVIAVPVREKHMRKLNVHRLECLGDQFGPLRFAAARVDEEPCMARSDHICVGALEGELFFFPL